MSWEIDLLESASDLEITQSEVTSLLSSTVSAAISGMMTVAIMTMAVKGFYGILGPKKFIKQEEEVLEIVEEVW